MLLLLLLLEGLLFVVLVSSEVVLLDDLLLLLVVVVAVAGGALRARSACAGLSLSLLLLLLMLLLFYVVDVLLLLLLHLLEWCFCGGAGGWPHSEATEVRLLVVVSAECWPAAKLGLFRLSERRWSIWVLLVAVVSIQVFSLLHELFRAIGLVRGSTLAH